MSDRTFKVILECKATKKQKQRVLSLPCSGEIPYSGCDALEVMRGYKKKRPLIRVNAITQFGKEKDEWEALTLAEMEELYGEDTDARRPWERRYSVN